MRVWYLSSDSFPVQRNIIPIPGWGTFCATMSNSVIKLKSPWKPSWLFARFLSHLETKVPFQTNHDFFWSRSLIHEKPEPPSFQTNGFGLRNNFYFKMKKVKKFISFLSSFQDVRYLRALFIPLDSCTAPSLSKSIKSNNALFALPDQK